jgi:hypothetical protein
VAGRRGLARPTRAPRSGGCWRLGSAAAWPAADQPSSAAPSGLSFAIFGATKPEQAVKRAHSAYPNAERAHRDYQRTPDDDAVASAATRRPGDSAVHAA